MWQRLSSVLAPEVSPLVDLLERWNFFLDFYTGRNQGSRLVSIELVLSHRTQPVEQTHLPHQLRRIVTILENDESGQCWKAVIDNDMLDVLSTICQADCPPGIRPLILDAFVAILSRLPTADSSTLMSWSVTQPVNRLLLLSILQQASPTESKEMRLISCIVSRVRRAPSLLSHFTVDTEDGVVGHALVAALLNLAESADCDVAIRAMDALVVVSANVSSDTMAKHILQTTRFSVMPVDRLERTFNRINLDRVDSRWIDDLGLVSWASQSVLRRRKDDDKARNELINFLASLDFLDHLTASAHVKLAEELGHGFRTCFLENVLEAKLISNVAAVALLTQIWRHLSKDHGHGLAKVTIEWLIDGVIDNLVDNWAIDKKKKKKKINTDPTDHVIVLETLGFFDSLLSKPCEPVLNALILDCLASKCYCSPSTQPPLSPSSSPLSSSYSTAPPPNWSELISGRRSKSLTSTKSISLAPTNIGRVLNSWLFLVPENLRQDTNASNDGFEQYLKNAESSVKVMSNFCMAFDWPMDEDEEDEEEDDAHSSDSRPEAEKNAFKETAFLKALLDRIQGMADNEYAVNLQITALVAKLVQLPHPNLHQFMLNPTTALAPGTRSLHGCLRRALSSIGMGLSSLSNLPRKSRACKRRLLMLSEDERREQRSMDEALRMLTPRELRCLEALIIIEEFAKELAAIALAKYHIFTS